MFVLVFSCGRGHRVRRAFVSGQEGVKSIGSDLRSALTKVHIIRSFTGRGVRQRGFRGDGRKFLMSGSTGCRYVKDFVDNGLFFRKVVCLVALIFNK